MKKAALSSAVLFFSAILAKAAVLLSDSFNYADGPLITVSGGLWMHHSGSTTGEMGVASGRLSVTRSDTEDCSAYLSGQPYDPEGGTNRFYASFVVNFSQLPAAAGNYFAHFMDTNGSFRARVWALTGGAGNNKFRLGLSSLSASPAGVTNSTDLSLNTDYTVVVRLINTNGAATLWINPSAETDAGVSTAEGSSSNSLVAFAFRQETGEGVMTVDDLRVGTAFTDVVPGAPAVEWPAITSAPQNQAVTEGSTATLTAAATGTGPLSYQWQHNGTNLPGATNAALVLSHASFADAGGYAVVVTNVLGAAGSAPASLSIWATSLPAFTLLDYNCHGNGTTNWSTNTPHVKAIGRQVQYLNPDIITFQEIPVTNNGTAQMTNFITAFRPGFFLATNSASDGFIRSVVLSRYPIVASRSWLHGSDLTPFGYSASGYTRDLFEAEIAVPGFPQHLHVFTVHLKSGAGSADDSAKRAAEAGAVSNFFATGFLTTNWLRPYLLTGDMNEDIDRPSVGSQGPIQRLASSPTGLQLTGPFNPATRSELTYSIQSLPLTRRYDYILPSGLLYSNVIFSQVFRTDLLSNPPPPLLAADDDTASDHLPVLMIFGNPYDQPFRLLSIGGPNPVVTLTWQAVAGQRYRVEISSNLSNWTTFADDLLATNATLSLVTNLVGPGNYFRVYRLP